MNNVSIAYDEDRQILELQDIYIVYIPLSDEEIKTISQNDNNKLKNGRPCWRIVMSK